MERVFQNVGGNAFLDKGIFINKELLEQCISYVEPQLEERPEIIIYGKICKQHRNVGFFSDESIGYKYSKKLMKSKPLSKSMTDLLVTVNKMLGTKFNGILVNKYIDGNDYIGAHSDDETGLDSIGVVAISYGSERIFRIRDKNDKTIVCDEPTTHCGILHMGGNFQKLYTHEIPIQKKIKGPRISFSFRKHTI
jgi:alkylated DNA repair dioxygenase AlkB